MWIFKRRAAGKLPPAAFNLERFQRALRGVPLDDELWPQLLALLDAYAMTEARAAASPGLDDAEAHRLRGRIGMCYDLKADLERLLAEARQPKE